jgi:arsenate reductase
MKNFIIDMSKVKVYYYNKCKTCRKVIEDLKNNNDDIELVEFFKVRFDKDGLKELLKSANISAKDALRKRDKTYKELELDRKDYSEDQLIELMVKYPSLIARPIIIKDNKVFIRGVNEAI